MTDHGTFAPEGPLATFQEGRAQRVHGLMGGSGRVDPFRIPDLTTWSLPTWSRCFGRLLAL